MYGGASRGSTTDYAYHSVGEIGKMTNDELTKFFSSIEWYDNSKIRVIRGCKRKAFYSLIGPRGTKLASAVGDGANFGSSFHAGLSRYYNTWGKFSESERRVFAARAFADEWAEYFPTEHMQSKHRLDNGLFILDRYCEHYLTEDPLYEPVESELGFAVKIESCKAGPVKCEPFHYVGRIDGIFRRIADDTYWLRETKTTGQTSPTAIEKRLKQLKFDHQPLGYVACIRQIQPQFKITGFLGDIIGVASQSLGFARDYFPVKQSDCDNWREQLINTVEDWRKMYQRGLFDLIRPGQPIDNINTFYQDTERCFDYGKCAFYELCDYGINNDTLAMFEENTWNPLLQRTPTRIEIN